jgi:hypothetical protein
MQSISKEYSLLDAYKEVLGHNTSFCPKEYYITAQQTFKDTKEIV